MMRAGASIYFKKHISKYMEKKKNKYSVETTVWSSGVSRRNVKRYEARKHVQQTLWWLSQSWPSFVPVVAGTQTGCSAVAKSATYCLDGHSTPLSSRFSEQRPSVIAQTGFILKG